MSLWQGRIHCQAMAQKVCQTVSVLLHGIGQRSDAGLVPNTIGCVPFVPLQPGGNQSLRYVYSDQWPGLKSSAEVEFAEVNSKLPELQAAYDQELASIEAGLDFYSNGQQID